MDPFILLLALPLAVGIYLIASTGRGARWRVARSLIGILLVAVPLGGLAYLFSGIWMARARGVGHFFSIPFGGYAVTDTALLSSLAFWVGLVFVLLAVAFRKRLKRLP
ncbi:MAG TPA: hypothetical protein VNM47_07985 [Terriglobia bacterium]|nr:hypothetical protein [Terriglobia bacterium]